jgi:formylglycine-generating enzyme required for sulfatase activity
MNVLEYSLDDWRLASEVSKTAWVHQVASRLEPRFRLASLQGDRAEIGGWPLPRFTDDKMKKQWVLVPTCRIQIGLSVEEEAAARAVRNPPPLNIQEVRPVHDAQVKPFLVMTEPVTWDEVQRVIELPDMSERPFADAGPSGPAYLTRDEATAIAAAVKFQLPTEVQWECACRGGTKTLFFFGDELPEQRSVLEAVLTSDPTQSRPNPFGLRCLFVGEWCRDRFRSSYDGPESPDEFAVRGGGSAFWPWQDDEWVFCMSAMRMPSSSLFDGLAALRLVLDLE